MKMIKKRGKKLDNQKKNYEEDYFELVVFLYNKLSQIYDVNQRRHLLLILLFYGMKFKKKF